MIVISKTPLRISFFGGGSDYPDYYEKYGGAVLGTTIDQYIHISIKKRTFYNTPYRFVYSKIEEQHSLETIEHPSIRETLRFMQIKDPLEIHVFSDLPAKTGLGSSSAFTVGLLNALYAYKGECASELTLAKQASFIEQQLIREHVGSQDQCHAAFGGLNLFHFSKEAIHRESLSLTKEKAEYLQKHLLLFFTGQTRFASEIAKIQIAQIKERLLDRTLEEMKSFVFEAKKILEKESQDKFIGSFAALLNTSWQLKRGLTEQIANSAIDRWYQLALSAGALGGKLCGAGGGGMMLFVAPRERHGAIKEALSPLQEIPVTFSKEGSQIIYQRC